MALMLLSDHMRENDKYRLIHRTIRVVFTQECRLHRKQNKIKYRDSTLSLQTTLYKTVVSFIPAFSKHASRRLFTYVFYFFPPGL